ncbi:hypothetical protein D3C85_612340 [compost metagenome]
MQLQACGIAIVQSVEVQAFIRPCQPQLLCCFAGLLCQSQRHALFFVKMLLIRWMRFTQQRFRLTGRDLCPVALEQVHPWIVRPCPVLVQQLEQLTFALTRQRRPLITQRLGTFQPVTGIPFSEQFAQCRFVKKTHYPLGQLTPSQFRSGYLQSIGC